MINLGNPTLLRTISNQIHQEQMRITYDVIAAPGVFHPSVSSERDTEVIHNPIVCNRTQCKYASISELIPTSLERCK